MAEIEGPRRPGSALAWLAAGAVTAVILGFGAALGLWFLPFVAGLAAGIAPWRARRALALVVLAVVVGWGAALWWPALSGAPAGATARVLAALAGLPPHAAVGVAATLLVGVLQGLVAVWLARAVAHRLPRGRYRWATDSVSLVTTGPGRTGGAVPAGLAVAWLMNTGRGNGRR
jgi:hypothetical protein